MALMGACAAIVLAGGRSSRMGAPKASLEWHGLPLLSRVVRLLARSVPGPIVVVRAKDQPLPELPGDVGVVEDAQAGRGPLEGIAAGMRGLPAEIGLAYVSSTDVPLLHPAFVRRVVAGVVAGIDVAVARTDGHTHPLAATYRTSVLSRIEEQLAADVLRPAALFERVPTRFLDEPDLLADPNVSAHDPELHSVRNLNRPDEYAAALAEPLPPVSIEVFGALRTAEVPSPVTARAATLGDAAETSGLTLDQHVVAALNGDQISRDPAVPLVSGDRVSFMSADAGG